MDSIECHQKEFAFWVILKTKGKEHKYHFYVVLVVKLLFSLTSLVTSPAGGSVSDSGIDPE
jgi:hypothetical protein